MPTPTLLMFVVLRYTRHTPPDTATELLTDLPEALAREVQHIHRGTEPYLDVTLEVTQRGRVLGTRTLDPEDCRAIRAQPGAGVQGTLGAAALTFPAPIMAWIQALSPVPDVSVALAITGTPL